MSRLFALILWFRDEPITGNVINLTGVKRPRKELADYKVGDVVWANCQGFGVCEGILARIEEEGHQKKLKALLHEGSDFASLVERFCPHVGPSEMTESGDTEPELLQVAPAAASQNMQKKTTRKRNPKEPRDNSQVVERRDLEKAAAELELTELTQSAFTTVQSGSSSTTESSSIVGESLGILNHIDPPVLCSPVPVHPRSKILEQEVENLTKKVKVLEERQTQTEQRLDWFWNFYQSRMTPGNHYGGHTGTVTNDFQDRSQPEATPAVAEVEPVPGPSFEQDQLRSKIAGIKSHSKASKLLFRSLYSESEYTGRSLGGNKANQKFVVRPALQHPERLDVLFEIMREEFPAVSVAEIKVRLREILKPCRFS